MTSFDVRFDVGLLGLGIDPRINGFHHPSQAAAQLHRGWNRVILLSGEMPMDRRDTFAQDGGQLFDVVKTLGDHGYSSFVVKRMNEEA
ncbi:hypothetical protein [Fundidesulfovibrio putealis]|uniref:hypothetical protein n=1 Tax=Fundidesulfovibrio putealis TaxID=270496 RepID=UPI000429AD41|nr:hypothetical protein [Fundidesulfovibrio putealis]